MHDIVLINVSGRDRPGITVALTEVLAAHDVSVLDIGQAVIHDQLAWGMLVELPPAAADGPVYRDLLFKAHELGLEVRFTPVGDEAYEHWLTRQGRPRHVVTLLARTLTARQVATVARAIAGADLNIDGIERLAGRSAARLAPAARRAAVELTVRGAVGDLSAMRRHLLQIATELGVDVAIQADDLYRRNRRLVCFDMDSTLVPVEVIDELAREAGVGDQVASITAAAMAGEIDFAESLRRRTALLAGLDESRLEAVADRMELTEGAERLIATLKLLGFRIAILSGGFTWFARRLQAQLGIDYVFANELELVDGRVTGAVLGPIVDGARKAELLRHIAAEEGISLAQTIAVGDGANDLPMLSMAGLGVAFRAKPVVRARASHGIAAVGLDGLLYLLGVRDDEMMDDPANSARGA